MNPLRLHPPAGVAAVIAGLLLPMPGTRGVAEEANRRVIRRTIHAEVVALDQAYFYNRLGSHAPDGMIYALKRDVVSTDPNHPNDLVPGKVSLRPGKRPRPLVLRMNVGDLLEVRFTNLLQPTPPVSGAAATRYAGLSVFGLELVDVRDASGKIIEPGKEHSGSFIGLNPTSLAKMEDPTTTPPTPAQTQTYRFYAPAEGTYLMASYADTTGAQSASGLFGAVNVQPEGAEYYRSQVTAEDLRAATMRPVLREGIYSLPGELFVRLSAMETDAEKMLRDKPEARLAAVRPPPVRGLPAPRELTLIRVNPLRRTTLTAKVEVTPDGRLLGETGHPLINYQAVYPPGSPKAGLPVLNMLQAVIDPASRFTIPLSSVPDAPRDLEGGIVSRELKDQFEKVKGVKLSDEATVTEQDGPAWLITDAGSKAYVIRHPSRSPSELDVYAATLTLVHGDLTAIITGPNADRFPTSHNSSSFNVNSAYPDRRQPYREYTIIYHQSSPQAQQAFPQFNNSYVNGYTQNTLSSGADGFGINYGIAGIGAEVLANRIGVGPMGRRDAVELKYEEFFLSAWAVGDPAMIVDPPANSTVPFKKVPSPAAAAARSPASQPPAGRAPLGQARRRIAQASPPPAKLLEALKGAEQVLAEREGAKPHPKALFPDDPSNVYHSYMRDHLKFRVLHAGSGPSHVHHLHAHQWLHTANSDTSTYLDSQLIIPGVAYTMEIAYGGSGNRNLTVGDSIFHCHFYPHFASGMWSLWRVHDTFEAGTELDAEGYPAFDARALPDGEIESGTPIPAVIPLPTLGMAPLPASVRLIDGGRRVHVEPARTPDGKVQLAPDGAPVYDRNPGYPFFIPGYAGHRPPHPPLDFAWKEKRDQPGVPDLKDGKKQYLNGGLPRHLVLGGEIVRHFETRWDFTKDFVLYDSDDKTKADRKLVAGSLRAFELPEDGTAVEKVAMATHAQRTHKTVEPDGFAGTFTLNGLPPVSGAPYAAPDVDDQGNSNGTTTRRYKAAALQIDVVQTKKGWHFPQQRFLTLWGDVRPTVAGTRPAQPFFFRSSTGDTVEFWHTNLVPSYYELDDFQVRTPTDILGQHIHLVKFDVTASDGAANGYNYEDGTFSPDEVRERIDAIDAAGGLYGFDAATQFFNPRQRIHLTASDYQKDYDDIFGDPPPYQNWNGAQTTIQRFDTDPLLNNNGVDRTLRTVFTHDHFGPSTHQQVGLYAAMLIEPQDSTWYLADGTRMNTRFDGGPTSWEGYIVPANPGASYREFALEFQDTQLAYLGNSTMSQAVPQTAVFGMDRATVQPLLPAMGSAKVADQVRTLFADHGISLSADAEATSLPTPATEDKQWRITNPLVKNPTVDAERQVFLVSTSSPPMPNGYSPPTPRPPTPSSLLYVTFSGKNPAMNPGWSDYSNALNPDTDSINWNQVNGPPFPKLISVGGEGVMSMNYRSEPVPLRLAPPATPVTQATDPAFAYSSAVVRNDPDLNVQPTSFRMDPNLESQLNPGQVSPAVLDAFRNAGHVALDPAATVAVVPLPRGQEWSITSTAGGTTTAFSIRKLTLRPGGTPQLVVATRVPGFDPAKPARTFPPPIVPLSIDAQRDGKDGGVTPGDPFTPMLRAYANDPVQVRTVVGAHLVPHSFQISGTKWRFEPADPNSGYRTAQTMGLSEHFEMLFTVPPRTSSQDPKYPFADYWYAPSSDPSGQVLGLWGILRAYDQEVGQGSPLRLARLPSNPAPGQSKLTLNFADQYELASKTGRPTRSFAVTATTANQCIPGSLVYNGRPNANINDPNAVLFVASDDLNDQEPNKGQLKTSGPVEPLILRAAAGEWIKVTIRNAINPTSSVFPNSRNFNYLTSGPSGNGNPPNVNMPVSTNVGLHPSLVAYDVRQADGMNIGYNGANTPETIPAQAPNQDPKAAASNERVVYWYAGSLELSRRSDGTEYIRETPIEFGGINLVPAEPMIQHQTGLYGALIIEPEGSRWVEDPGTRASAVVTKADGTTFREHVLVWQNDVENFGLSAGYGAVNYRTEPFGVRNINPSQPVANQAPYGWQAAFSNTALNPDPTQGDPQTPTFVAPAGMPTRLRMLFPGGSTNNGALAPAILVLQAHNWQEEPYTAGGRRIGNNPLSQYLGAQEHSAYEALNLVLPRAGGTLGVAGDYLYHSYQVERNNGTWGLFQVQPGGVFITRASTNAVDQLSAEGLGNADQDGKRAASVDLYSVKLAPDRTIQSSAKITQAPLPVNAATGAWRLDASAGVTVPQHTMICATTGAPPPGSATGTILVVIPQRTP
jgi:hypothetical protein